MLHANLNILTVTYSRRSAKGIETFNIFKRTLSLLARTKHITRIYPKIILQCAIRTTSELEQGEGEVEKYEKRVDGSRLVTQMAIS